MDLKAIGRRIKAAREVKGLTQEALSELVNFKPHAYLETAGFKLAHLWGFLWGNAFFPEVVPGYTPDTALTARYVQMASMDIGFPIQFQIEINSAVLPESRDTKPRPWEAESEFTDETRKLEFSRVLRPYVSGGRNGMAIAAKSIKKRS